VVLPKTNTDIQTTVQLCAEHRVPIVPRGGSSGLCGQAIGPGVVIDPTKFMTRVLDVDTHSRSACVQAGAVLVESVFNWPGLGGLFFSSLRSRDYPVLMGLLDYSAVLIVAFNLIADVVYAWLDQRIKYG
jgi:hypothetical protein